MSYPPPQFETPKFYSERLVYRAVKLKGEGNDEAFLTELVSLSVSLGRDRPQVYSL